MKQSTKNHRKHRTAKPSDRGLERAILAARTAEDNRGTNIVILDMRELTSVFDFFIIVSGTSRRQLHAMSEEIDRVFEQELGDQRMGIEGYEESRWILLDYGDLVVHLFEPETREYYALEQLWSHAKRVPFEPRRTKTSDCEGNSSFSIGALVVGRYVEARSTNVHPSTTQPSSISMNILPALKSRFRSALAGLLDDPAEIEKSLDLIRRSQDPKFGDYQANMAMPLGKKLGRPPRDIAAEIIERLDVADLCQTPEIAGPGFINLRVKDEWLVGRLAAAVDDDRLGVPPVEKPRTYVVDYSAPNVAKPMHVGHIRSTVIGDALCRTLRFLGHNAISDNHIGDWGTQFGMILYGYKNFLDAEAYQEESRRGTCPAV